MRMLQAPLPLPVLPDVTHVRVVLVIRGLVIERKLNQCYAS